MVNNNIDHRPLSAETLQTIYLFRTFNPQQLATMVAATDCIQLKQGQRLFNQGDPIQQFFYLESGQIKLYRVSPEGHEKVIDLIGAQQTFAEAVVFMERNSGYPVHAEALESTRVFGFSAPIFLGLLKQSNESCLQLMGVMSKRLRWQVNEIDRLALQSATSRFVGFILNPGTETVTDGSKVELNMPKNVLASRLSIQPETFSRILARLSAAGLIEVVRQGITLRDTDKLRELLRDPG